MAASPAPTSTPRATAPAELPPVALEKLLTIRQLLTDNRTKDAAPLAAEVADAYPAAPEAQLLAGEAMYRLARWDEAYDYFHRAGDTPVDRPDLLFYFAVAAYETDHPEEAASLLEPALPHLKRTPFVDGYAARILPAADWRKIR